MLAANYDAETVHSIVNAALVVHVSFNSPVAGPFPVCLPMIGRMGLFSDDEEPSCYLHGYVSARLFKLPNEESNGLPVCVTATKVDGLVLALTPFNHSYNYRSAVLYGYAELLEPDSDENLWAMQLITDSIVPGRWDYARKPDSADMASTRILKIRIESASAKVRDGGPKEDRKDLKNDEVVNSVWTGVVPMYETFAEPIPGAQNKVAKIPAHVEDLVRSANSSNEKEALELSVREKAK